MRCVFFNSKKSIEILQVFTTRRGVLRFYRFLQLEEEYWDSTGLLRLEEKYCDSTGLLRLEEEYWDSTGFF